MQEELATEEFRVGFDLGGTKMLALAIGSKQRILGRKKRKSRGMDGAKDGVERICQTIEQLITESGLNPSNLRGIGIGCPGPIDLENGTVQLAVNLGWKNFAIGPHLEKVFNCPVSVLNDVDAGVYGEYCFGAAIDSRCVVGIFPGTGIGGGCVYEGNILRGRRFSAMEIGHTKISSSNRRGGIDMLGTLESEASRLSIASECVRLAYRGEAPNLLKSAGTDLSEVRSKTIADAIKKGDIQVELVVKRAIEQIAYSAVNLVHLLSPDMLVLGGGMVEAMPEMFVQGVDEIVNRYVLDCYKNTCKVVAAELHDDAAALGAAAWVEKHAAVAGNSN